MLQRMRLRVPLRRLAGKGPKPAPLGPPLEGFEGINALVTGSARGIGRSIAEALLREGAAVIGVDRDWAGLGSDFEGLGGTVVEADVGLRPPGELAAELLAIAGPIPVIVNNAGINTPKRFMDLDAADLDLVMNTNLRGPWLMTRDLVEALVDGGRRGSVLFIGSVHSFVPRAFPHYSASKAALVMLVREMAHDLGPRGIRVNLLSPGWIHHRGAPPPRSEVARIPIGYTGLPADIAGPALALLDDRVSAYVTGADLVVDGGLSTHSWIHDAHG